jgi:hypothetical protein
VSECSVCGLDPAKISPVDARDAVRSFPRRFRELLVRPDDERLDSLVRRSPSPAELPAIAHGAYVTQRLAELGAAIEHAVWSGGPGHDPDAFDAGDHVDRPVEDVLRDLDAASARLVGIIDRVDPGDWQRTDGDGHSASWLAGEAAHEGAHHLRVAERVLDEVRGR